MLHQYIFFKNILQSLAELSLLLTKLPEDRVMSLYTRHLCNPDLPDSVKACLISGLQKLMCGSILSKETMATRLAESLKFKQPVLIKQVSLFHPLNNHTIFLCL